VKLESEKKKMENDFVLAIDIKTNGERGECFWIAAVVFNKKEKNKNVFLMLS